MAASVLFKLNFNLLCE